MHQPMFVRGLTDAERQELTAGLRSRDGFRLRRCQVLLASAAGEHAPAIARRVGCCPQTARDVIAAFNDKGLACLTPASTRPRTAAPVLDAAGRARLADLLHQSPRTFGKARSTWTLELAAEVAHERGLTPRRLSDESVRRAVGLLGGGWKRAKHWVVSPDPAYARKKRVATA